MMRGFTFILAFAFALSSCTGKKKPVDKTERFDEASVVEGINRAHTPVPFFTARGKGSVKGPGMSQGFKIDIRNQRDSILWIDLSAALFGIKVARMIATPDSVKFYNRLDKTFMISSIKDLEKLVNTNIDFQDFQSLISGIPITRLNRKTSPQKKDGTYRIIENNGHRTIESVFDQSSLLLIAQLITDEKVQQTILAAYRSKNKSIPPDEITLKTTFDGQEIEVHLIFDNIDTVRKPSYPFDIPSGYKAI